MPAYAEALLNLGTGTHDDYLAIAKHFQAQSMRTFSLLFCRFCSFLVSALEKRWPPLHIVFVGSGGNIVDASVGGETAAAAAASAVSAAEEMVTTVVGGIAVAGCENALTAQLLQG